MTKMHLFDYLYYAFTRKHNVLGIKLLMAPYLWLIPIICSFISNRTLGLIVVLAIGLALYLTIDHIYNKKGGRGDKVVKHFEHSKYGTTGWKIFAFIAWLVVFLVIPLALIAMHKKGWV